MKLFKVYYEATIGAAYVRAATFDKALDKLSASEIGEDSRDVRFDIWGVDPHDLGSASIHDIQGEDLQELDPSEAKRSFEIMFPPKRKKP